MKIQYLGTAAAEGIPAIFCDCVNCKKARKFGGRHIRTRSQALIDDTILIDFPADTYMHFLQYNVPLNKIKTCLITHSHSDHIYPNDITMRKDGFAHLDMKEPLTFYTAEDGYNKHKEVIDRNNIDEDTIKLVKINAGDVFEAEGYKITAVKAMHDPNSSPVLFVLEKDGKSIFYANDSSEYDEEGMATLKGLDKPLNVVSFDCTEACKDATYVGHLTLDRCIELRKKLLAENITDENTVFILNHFSHNGAYVGYDEFTQIAAKHDFLVSYDGMEYEF